MQPDTFPRGCADDPSWICQRVLDISDGNEALADFVDGLAGILLIVIVTLVIVRLTRRYISRITKRIVSPDESSLTERLRKISPEALRASETEERRRNEELRRTSRAESISSVVTATTVAIIWVTSGLLILGELGVSLGPLIAGAGLAGAALSFGAQSLIRDCISGLFVLIEDQYGLGDYIDLGEATGTVEEITLRATVVRSIDGTVWHVPNGEVQRVGNMSQLWSIAVIDVDVAYDADLAGVRTLMLEAATEVCESSEWESTVLEPPQVLGVEHLGADGITIRLITKTTAGGQWGLQRALRETLKARLDEAGIEIPFPQRTVWLRSETG